MGRTDFFFNFSNSIPIKLNNVNSLTMGNKIKYTLCKLRIFLKIILFTMDSSLSFNEIEKKKILTA